MPSFAPPPIPPTIPICRACRVPAAGAAIAKAITGAYLSSGGNAFSTRTASEIVQQFFPPTAAITPGLEGGPLFGVQFSQLPCSDLSQRFVGGRRSRRFHRSQAFAAGPGRRSRAAFRSTRTACWSAASA